MELRTLILDADAIGDGRWVDGAEVPSLGDVRIKVRGSQASEVRRMLEDRERAGEDRVKAFSEILFDHCLVAIEGLTNGGEPVTVEALRPLLREERSDPLRVMILDALRAVDGSREKQALDLSKN